MFLFRKNLSDNVIVNIAVTNNSLNIFRKNTAQNSKVSPDSLVWKFCGNAQLQKRFHAICPPKTRREKHVSTILPHQNIS